MNAFEAGHGLNSVRVHPLLPTFARPGLRPYSAMVIARSLQRVTHSPQ